MRTEGQNVRCFFSDASYPDHSMSVIELIPKNKLQTLLRCADDVTLIATDSHYDDHLPIL